MANTIKGKLKENKLTLQKVLEENGVDCSFCLKENKEDAIDIDFEEPRQRYIVYLFTRGRRDILHDCESFLEAARFVVEIEKPKKSAQIMEKLTETLSV